MEFEEAYSKFVQSNGTDGNIIALEKMLIADFRQDPSPSLRDRVANACLRVENAYKANIFPEGDPRRMRNIVCYKRLSDRIKEFRK